MVCCSSIGTSNESVRIWVALMVTMDTAKSRNWKAESKVWVGKVGS